MWFFICEGFHYTHNVKQYILRLDLFALVSRFVYCFAFGSGYIPFKGGLLNSPTSVVYPLLKQYNGERVKATWMKWLFYIYYPAHLVVIGVLRLLPLGNVSILF